MKKLLKLGASALAITLAANAATAEGKLVIYNWFEYLPQELIDKFAAQENVEVTMDTFDSNEAMLASLKAGKMGTYDVAMPSDYMVDIMGDEGMLDTFDQEEIPNFSNIMDQWLNVSFDPGRNSSVPYQWGSTSFSVNRDAYKGDINTLAMIFNPPNEVKGKINVLDSQGEVLALGSMYLGIPQCSTDREELKALNNLMLEAKPHWASFGSDVAKDVLVSGDASVGMIWSGFGAKAREEGANIEYAFPKEGYVVWTDSIVLLKDAPNRANALKFMNFMLEPENAAALTNFAAYTAGVKGVEPFLSDTVANSPESNPPAEPIGELVMACPQEVQAVYDTIWTNLKK